MKTYGNLSGTSGVTAYEIEDEGILVEFNRDKIYRYTYTSAGRGAVEMMKTLAQQGRGLSTYISRNVKERYEEIVK
ncbi:hypothetical protein GCM10007103_31750 [Salinimicrobium marinum]|uniref:Uncharacterized protein n=1 Tax=Salinimicrobium marinum TaxID=680283 RepID=A0A918W194_9FLAO|nr:hypothetical protein [Salinimicrobium marinum]GHA48512.1 hypothetical protein GCM10007103_31750 [Salinimicrobium marinum]